MVSLTLVVGAGASAEMKLPVGAELKLRIAERLNVRLSDGGRLTAGSAEIYQALRVLAGERRTDHQYGNRLHQACWRVSRAMPLSSSIDNYVDSHRADEDIALVSKLGIGRAILEAERASTLYFDESTRRGGANFSALSPAWLVRLFQMLTDKGDFETTSARLKSVVIVCFNYDRCIEFFLFHALQTYFDVTDTQAESALANLRIFHPYGTVGAIPYRFGASGTQFGEDVEGHRLIEVARQISTFSEGIDPKESNIEAIQSAVRATESLVFLGFAFHPINMKMLFPTGALDSRSSVQRLIATGQGISRSDAGLIVAELSANLGLHEAAISFESGLSCAALFDEYRRTLAV